jgi:hypothetical protein
MECNNMASPTKEEKQAQVVLDEFFKANPDCFALAYNKDNLARYIVKSGGWSEFGDTIELVQLFSGKKLDTLSEHIYVGAYTKFKSLATPVVKDMDDEFKKVCADYPDDTVTGIWERMAASKRMSGIRQRGRDAKEFAETKVPKIS